MFIYKINHIVNGIPDDPVINFEHGFTSVELIAVCELVIIEH